MVPFKYFNRRWCRSPVGWFESFEARFWGTSLLIDLMDRVRLIHHNCYADYRVNGVAFILSELVLLRISPMKGAMRFRNKWKLCLRFIGPSKIFKKVRDMDSSFSLPTNPSTFHLVFLVSMLKWYCFDDFHVIKWNLSIVKLRRLLGSLILIYRVDTLKIIDSGTLFTFFFQQQTHVLVMDDVTILAVIFNFVLFGPFWPSP